MSKIWFNKCDKSVVGALEHFVKFGSIPINGESMYNQLHLNQIIDEFKRSVRAVEIEIDRLEEINREKSKENESLRDVVIELHVENKELQQDVPTIRNEEVSLLSSDPDSISDSLKAIAFSSEVDKITAFEIQIKELTNERFKLGQEKHMLQLDLNSKVKAYDEIKQHSIAAAKRLLADLQKEK